MKSEQESRVSTLPATHGRYSAMGIRPVSDTGNYNILRHHPDSLRVMSQPYDALNHPESKRSSLNLSPNVSPRTSPSNSRSSLSTIGDTIVEEETDPSSTGSYDRLDRTSHPPELPPRNAITPQNNENRKLRRAMSYEPLSPQGEYGKLGHTSRPPEPPQRRISAQEYGKLDLSTQHSTVPENEYGKLDYIGHPPELPQERATIREHEYGKLNRYSQPPELPQKKTTDQDNEYGRLNCSTQHNEPQGQYLDYVPQGGAVSQENEYSKLNHTSQPPEPPQKRISAQQYEYEKLDLSTQYSTVPENEYGKLDYIGPLELPQKRATIRENEYGKLNHSSQPPGLPQKRTTDQDNEYGRLNCSTQHNEPQGQYLDYVPQGGAVSQENEYSKLNHTSQPPELSQKVTTIQENEYGKLDYIGPPELPQKRATIRENEYGKLNRYSQPPELPQKRTTDPAQHNEPQGQYLDYVPQRGAVSPENEYSKLNHTPELSQKRTTIQENEYGELGHTEQQHGAISEPQNEYGELGYTNCAYTKCASELSQGDVVQENEYGKLAYNYHQSATDTQQNASILQLNNRQNQEENFSAAQPTYTKYKPQIPHRKDRPSRHSPSVETKFSPNAEMDNIPSGYETFKRMHGESVCSSISSYTDGLDDDLTDTSDSHLLASNDDDNNDKDYSQLSLKAVGEVDRSQASEQRLVIAPNPTYLPSKPKPKPRKV